MKLAGINLSEQAQSVLQLAEQAAREFRHEYIGTEHLLLGLILQGEGIAATALRSRGLDEARVRQEIEEVIQHGPHEVTLQTVPLTPRSQRALEFAAEEARIVGLEVADTEHILLGLLRELESVAGLILHKHGLNVLELREEVLKIRLLQMKIVERVVRPLRANIARKRRMRNELLAHLSAIFDEELVRLGDPLAAVDAAAKRFGDLKELTSELQATVPRLEQWEARLESIFGWRAPETIVRWMTRVAIQISLLMGFMYLIVALFAVRELGWSWLILRPLAACVIVTGIIIALSGICYYKIRDSIFGTFGLSKSKARAITWAALLTMSTMVCGLTFKAVAYGNLSSAAAVFYPWLATCIIWTATVLVFARVVGPQGIRDATWAMLDLNDQRVTT